MVTTSPAAAWKTSTLSRLIGAVLISSALAYGGSLPFPYVQDAVSAVRLNPVVARADIAEIFASDYWADTASPARSLYRPIAVLSFALERRLGGELQPWRSRLINILLHDLAAVFLYLYARRLGAAGSHAVVAALIFTVHPLLLQGVANVVGRADLLATAATLIALLAISDAAGWTGAPRRSPARQRVASWLAGAAVFLALGSKEVALATPLLVALHGCLLPGLPRWRDGLWTLRAALLAPTALATVIYIVLRTLALEAFPGRPVVPALDNVLVQLEGVAHLSTALGMAGRYLLLFVLPIRLSADYSGSVIQPEYAPWGSWPVLGLTWLVLLVGLILAPFLRRLRATSPTADVRILAASAALYLTPYLVIGNLIVLNAAGFAERLVYMCGTGFALLVAWPASIVWRSTTRARARHVLAAVGAMFLLLAANHTRIQCRMWRSLDQLYEHALAAQPRALLASFGLAEYHRREGRPDVARRIYERAVTVNPQSADLWWGLGGLLRERGDLDSAEGALRRAVEVEPELPRAHLQLGLILAEQHRFDEAERALKRALLLNPRLDRAVEALAEIAERRGAWSEATQLYRRAVAMGRRELAGAAERAAAEANRRPTGHPAPP